MGIFTAALLNASGIAAQSAGGDPLNPRNDLRQQLEGRGVLVRPAAKSLGGLGWGGEERCAGYTGPASVAHMAGC